MISVQEADFDAAQLHRQLRERSDDAGAIVTFTGYVRDFAPSQATSVLHLEHYPGMCERVLTQLGEHAAQRWQLSTWTIVHRVGALARGDQIVFVGVASRHRGNAFRACEFIIDTLKTNAPFWKREVLADGRSFWVQQKEADSAQANQWQAQS